MPAASPRPPVQRIFILAGEASGDAYGGKLVSALRARNPEVEIRCWGGEAMEEAGATCLRHYRTLAFMGFWEVLKNAGTIRKLFRECRKEIADFRPDVFVGIDYPGFNLRMARKAKAMGIQTHHYISPSVWAWKKNRVHAIRRDIDRLHVILPFEKKWYDAEGLNVHWVGHPLLELLPAASKGDSGDALDKPILLLLPGSRQQELDHILPIMVKAARSLPAFKPVIAGAPGRTIEDYRQASEAGIEIVFGQTRALMQSASAGLITSGTATLEAALLGLPHIICYRTSPLTFALAKALVKTQWIGLPNLLLERNAVTERIQEACRPAQLVQDVLSLHDGTKLLAAGERQKSEFDTLVQTLQEDQPASELVAESILGS
jgi:lipid-A-disaccharide synthase